MGKLETIRKSLKEASINPEDITDAPEYQIGLLDILRALGQLWADLRSDTRFRDGPDGIHILLLVLKHANTSSRNVSQARSEFNE